MAPSITSPQVQTLLDTLYADAATNDPAVRQAALAARMTQHTEMEFFTAMRLAYLPVSRQFGNLLYALARGARARTIVEFGTSFGLSTIFLAAALRDNGEGTVITTEFEPGKAERARANLAAAGLDQYVEIRLGDARETLRTELPQGIDLLLLDGAKGMYLEVLKLVEPGIRPGGIVASDNTDHDGLGPFLAHVRGAGYLSSAILTAGRQRGMGHEVSIRI